jgi:hypothetical protein
MSTQWMQIAVVGTILTIGGPVHGAAQSSQTKTDTYTWNGEFVSLDTTAKTMTVKSRVAYQEAISELKHLKAGDRVWIVWSGIHDSSDAVRQVRRSEAGRTIDETLGAPRRTRVDGGAQSVPHDSSQGTGERVVGDQHREARRVGDRHVPPPAVE